MCFIYAYILIQNVIKNHLIILFKIVSQKYICIVRQHFTSKDEINKSSGEVTTHYQVIGLYSENVIYDILIFSKFLDSFWNVFNNKLIKIFQTVTIYMQSLLVCSYRSILIYLVNKHL